MEEYVSSGEGYWYDSHDPTKGIYGIPPEIDREIEEKWRLESILNEERNKLRKVKALKLIRQSQGRDIKFKINFLKGLGYSHANIKVEPDEKDKKVSFGQIKEKDKKVSFGQIKEKDYPNISRFYDRTIEELRKIVKNPSRDSKLVERLDSIQ